MALTYSNMLPLNTVASAFELLDTTTDKLRSLEELRGQQGTVIMFICNHCPFVKHIQKELVNIAKDYQTRDITFIAISANDAETYAEDAPDKMKEVAKKMQYPFPFLYDETQNVAKAYHAACTPDFFVFDEQLKCVYRGQLDDSRPNNGVPITGHDLRDALENLLTGKLINQDQKPSLGCNIKWKEKN